MRRYDIDSLENRDPEAIGQLIEWLAPILKWYFRPSVTGMARIPQGPCLYVGNHSGGLVPIDAFVFCGNLYKHHGVDAIPYGLGHEVAISLPIIHQFVVPLGAVRASHENAHRLFEAGKKVLVFPGGDIDSMRPFRDRDRIIFGHRRGYIRLALRAGVPIIPVVTAGGQATFLVVNNGRRIVQAFGIGRFFRTEVWPVTISAPWGLTFGAPPAYIPLPSRFFQEVLPPFHFEPTGAEAADDADYVEECHQRVHSAMEEALQRLARQRRSESHIPFLRR